MDPDIEESPPASSGEGEGSVPETGPGWRFSEDELPALITHSHTGALSICSSLFLPSLERAENLPRADRRLIRADT